MGAWGTGFWSDDYTMDLKNSYLDRVRRKVAPEEAVTQLVEEFQPERDEETGHLFWLTIALLQWEYGHLSPTIHTRAMEVLDSNVDAERWNDADRRDQRKRKEVMDKLRAKLFSENPKPKKLKPYVRKRNPWKVGDVISIYFEHMQTKSDPRFHPFQGMYGAVLVVDFWEQDLGDIHFQPVVALYDWIGKEPATMEQLEDIPFIRTELFQRHEARYFWVTDMPWKWVYDWYGLTRIGHLDTLPFPPEVLSEGYEKSYSTPSWGTIALAIVDHRLQDDK